MGYPGQKLLLLSLLALIIALPFMVQRDELEAITSSSTEKKLIIITPHIETIRYEFTEGFKKWYQEKRGEPVDIDWRVLGGTQEIMRYINSAYANAFELYWERDLAKLSSMTLIRNSFSNPKIALSKNPEDQNEAESIRRAFLDSNVSCGIDLLFGGGEVEIKDQSERGQIVPSGIIEKKLEWFNDDSIPQTIKGCPLRDPNGKWIGVSNSSFGIIYNQDTLDKLKIEDPLLRWDDLANETLMGEVALADPTISTSCMRVFEMVIQQHINKVTNGKPIIEVSEQELAKGWNQALKVIQLIMANARYFTDSSTKPVLDVAAGDCGAGVALDAYGMYQEENLKLRGGSQRFHYVAPRGGTAVTPDPIALLKGAPHPELALAFIEYVLSLEGQKLWNFKVGVPGGPMRYSLARAAVRKEVYQEKYYQYRSNPELNPYRESKGFTYHPEWTAGYFKELRFVLKAAFIDAHAELVEARMAIINAKKEGNFQAADEAFIIMTDLGSISYEEIMGNIRKALSSGNHLHAIKLQSKLSRQFRRQYKQAKQHANARR